MVRSWIASGYEACVTVTEAFGVCLYRYPRLTEANVSNKCPFCKGNCNCKACLRTSGPKRVVVEKSEEEKTKYFKYILSKILPVLKQIEQEQNDELQIERKIQGSLNPFNYGNLWSFVG